MTPMQHNPNAYHDPHEWPSYPAVLISTDVLSALLPAAVSFYKVALESRQARHPYALTTEELTALRIAIDHAIHVLGVEEQYTDFLRR